MQPPVFWLTNLARAEARLERAREARRGAQRRRRDLDELAREDSAAAEEARRRQLEAVRAARDCEMRLRAREVALQRLQQRQTELRNAREGEALAREIAAARQELAALEDAALRWLEEADALAEQARAHQARADASREKATREEAAAAAADANAARLEASLADEVRTCEQQLPPTVAAAVARLRRGVTPPVVALVGSACGGCGAQPPPQQVIEVERSRESVRCEACGRFLVAPE